MNVSSAVSALFQQSHHHKPLYQVLYNPRQMNSSLLTWSWSHSLIQSLASFWTFGKTSPSQVEVKLLPFSDDCCSRHQDHCWVLYELLCHATSLFTDRNLTAYSDFSALQETAPKQRKQRQRYFERTINRFIERGARIDSNWHRTLGFIRVRFITARNVICLEERVVTFV